MELRAGLPVVACVKVAILPPVAAVAGFIGELLTTTLLSALISETGVGIP